MFGSRHVSQRPLIIACSMGVLLAMQAYAAPMNRSQRDVAGQRRSVWNGVYTLQQAKRGQEQYDIFCARCHGSDMQGDTVDVPALSDTKFARKWDRRVLKELFLLMSERMPENRPGTLSKETYADLLAYILQGNGFPNGIAELSRDPDDLARITFDEAAPDPR